MRRLLQIIKEETKHYDSIWQYIYLHEWFDPFRRLYNLPKKLYGWLDRFIYYGLVGAKECVDYDAMSIHNLIYAHIRRLRRFMSNPNNTHTMWTTKPNKGLFRRLKELEEYSRRYSCGEDQRRDNFSNTYEELREKYGYKDFFDVNYPNEIEKDKARKLIKKALQKDERVIKSQNDRYFELLQEYVPRFWD
jgi:hypothetical protein